MEQPVDQLIAELTQVEDEIRRLSLHARGDGRVGGLCGGLGGSSWTSGGLGAADAELRELLAREQALTRALRSRDGDRGRR